LRLFNYEITKVDKGLNSVPRSGWRTIFESFTGAWQRNAEVKDSDIRMFFAIYACVTLISGDIAKLRPRIIREKDGIWAETKDRDLNRLIKNPNRYQNHIQFKQWWIASKLLCGNTYVLKERNSSGSVVALYILDPMNVQVLVADDGSVYYQLNQDNLAGTPVSITVPASEIIHDRYQPMSHPLVGIPPVAAAALSGKLGLQIMRDSQAFFQNGAKPGGLLSAPGAISDATAKRLKEIFDSNYSGSNSGKVAVVGDGLKFEPMRAKSVDSQLVEQLKLSADIVCSCFHVQPFKIGLGTLPSGSVEDMNLIYYSDCLQINIEEFEQCISDGLIDSQDKSIELDVDGLIRMDSEAKINMLSNAVKGIMKTNEARARLNLPPVDGGDTVLAQQQNYSLAALARRDAKEDPFAKSTADQSKTLAQLIEKELCLN
jgi:HK97 family phage portal protein